MKKYVMPTIKVATIKTTAILAGSGEDEFNNKTTTGEQLGKNSIWSSMEED